MSELTTQRLDPTPIGLARATDLLSRGGLVAFPTETVYGLGADACNDHAVARIYTAKGRPSFNPLIAHVADIGAAQALTEWTDQAETLAQAFWPGPLTLVLRKRDNCGLSKLLSAGQDTVAVRVPEHPVAHSLLRAFGGPVAAPSANRSGQISPTLADHVVKGMSGRIEAVVDGGRCQVGLESTIIGLAGRPTLLRPGQITIDRLHDILGTPVFERKDTETITAPGQLTSHYAPHARVRLNAVDWQPGELRLGFGAVACDLNLSPSGDMTEAAANLFEYLHRLDAQQAEVIAVSPIPHLGLGVAINDRLTRAAAPRETPEPRT
ncbi:MAG: threonylcarbamoyl-AMP synthase [Rhodobacteraceae bacterium]|nr:threonylcarbamoyl-AMP synthase [Paracoccaceae bacterium]